MIIYTCLQKASCLCLLDLSVAFDAIDHHNILITRLYSWLCFSWFAYHLAVYRINVITTLYVIIPAYVVSLKVLFLVLRSSSCTLPLLVRLFHLFP